MSALPFRSSSLLRRSMPMAEKVLLIDGIVETDKSTDDWLDDFIEWIESRGEYFAGAGSTYEKEEGDGHRNLISIAGSVETGESVEKWNDEFLQWLERRGEGFTGSVKELEEVDADE